MPHDQDNSTITHLTCLRRMLRHTQRLHEKRKSGLRHERTTCSSRWIIPTNCDKEYMRSCWTRCRSPDSMNKCTQGDGSWTAGVTRRMHTKGQQLDPNARACKRTAAGQQVAHLKKKDARKGTVVGQQMVQDTCTQGAARVTATDSPSMAPDLHNTPQPATRTSLRRATLQGFSRCVHTAQHMHEWVSECESRESW